MFKLFSLFLALILIKNVVGSSRAEEAAQESGEDFQEGVSPASGPLCAKVSPLILKEIEGYRPIIERIGHIIIYGSYRGVAFKNLTDFLDTYGSRLTGSEALEKAIDHVLEKMKDLGFSNVHSEDVIAPKWVRGDESLEMLHPYKKKLQVLGLVPTVQTPEGGITSEIVVINDFRELQEDSILKRVKGKILVYNHVLSDAVTAIRYRHRGAIEGAKVGAIATLTRSYATFSLATPHTGEMHYDDKITAIPSAEIAIEDAEFLSRLYDKDQKVVINLKLHNQRLGNITTRNSIGDFLGSKIHNEFMMVSGHIDSWDVGQGALDDGYGVILSILVPSILKTLNLIPKRTIRTIIWTAEEISDVPLGAEQYLASHLEELSNYTMFLEADSGIFNANGLIFNGSNEAQCIVSQILKLLEPTIIAKTQLVPHFPQLKTDIVPLMKATGVPGALFHAEGGKYLWYHHSNADTISALNPKDMDVCLAMMTSLSYVLADLSILLPKQI